MKEHLEKKPLRSTQPQHPGSTARAVGLTGSDVVEQRSVFRALTSTFPDHRHPKWEMETSSLEHKHLIRPQSGLPDRGSAGNKTGKKKRGHGNLIKRGGGTTCSRNKLISCHCLPCGPARSNPHDIQ